MGDRPVFKVTVDFEQVGACVSGQEPAQVWEKVLSCDVSRTILDQVAVAQLSGLIISGLTGKELPKDKLGFLARKVLKAVTEPRFAQFVAGVRHVAEDMVNSATQAAAAYLPANMPGAPIPVTVRFTGFALADAFSPPGGPVINLGDMFFLVHEKIGGTAEVRLEKSLRLVRRLIAHELHHIGLGRFIAFPKTPNSEWLLKFIISEGVATVLMLPFTEDDAYYHERWAEHSGQLERYVWDLSDALAESQDRIPQDVWDKWIMNVGAAYYLGASMTQAIDRAFGRECLLEAITGVSSFFRLYNSAAAKWRLPALVIMDEWDGRGL